MRMKRVFDFIVAFTGSILLLPVSFFASVYSGQRPCFFTQKIVGKGGRLFTLYKFMSMRVCKSARESVFNIGDKSRITPIGKTLRKTKLDELSQLFNVLLGDLSLVGPWPELEKWVKAYSQQLSFVHTVRPGITDFAAIEFRYEEELLAVADDPEKTYMEIILPRKLELYKEYIENQTFLGDIKLIFKTLMLLLFKSDNNS